MAGIERDRQQPDAATELGRGVLGTLFIGQTASRVVLRRRISVEPPWDARALDALAESSAYARGIHHPSVLAVLDAKRSPEGLLATTEYVEGVTLASFLARAREANHKLPVRLALRVAEDLARSVTAAQELLESRGYSRPLVGLHPECVILTSGDDALIGDLGIVLLEHAPNDPRIQKYRAPELASGKSSPSASVYGLGLMLWEMLSGHEAGEALVPRLDRITKDVPPLVVELVMQSVSVDPKKRSPDPAAFAKALVAAGNRRRPGELVRQLNELTGDLLEKQRSVLGASDVAPTSWRPTMHALETLPPPGGPRAPKPIGLAAFRKTEPPPEPASSAVVSAPQSLPIDVEVDLPPPPASPSARPPQATVPLLLVNKQSARGGETSPSTTGSTISFPPDDFRPRRRWGLALFLLVVLGGAAAFGVFAVREQLRPREELALPDPLPEATGSSAEPALAPDGKVAGSAPAKPVGAQPKPIRGTEPARGAGPDAAALPSASAEPGPSAAPAETPPTPAPAGEDPELPENPYKPPAAPSAEPDPKSVFGY